MVHFLQKNIMFPIIIYQGELKLKNFLLIGF